MDIGLLVPGDTDRHKQFIVLSLFRLHTVVPRQGGISHF